MPLVRECQFALAKKQYLVKVRRDRYIRDDICCGIVDCKLCLDVWNLNLIKLDKVQRSPSKVVDSRHILLLDTNIIRHQVDVLTDERFSNIIICNTVLKELKQCFGQRIFRTFLTDEKKAVYIFKNEFFRGTCIVRNSEETIDERNDRAIRHAAVWYRDHLKQLDSDVTVVLLSDDEQMVQRAVDEGLLAFTLEFYVSGFDDSAMLLDKFWRGESKKRSFSEGSALFDQHLTLEEMKLGLANGLYKLGTFQVSRENYLEAHVILEDEQDRPIFIEGLLNFNRAIQNDVVVVQMLPEEEWSCPASVLRLQEFESEFLLEKSEAEDRAQRLSNARARGDIEPTGKVVGIWHRACRTICGVLEPASSTISNQRLFTPSDRRLPRVLLDLSEAAHLVDQRIVATIDCWPISSRYPIGHFVRELGKIGDRQTENEALLLEHDVPHQCFSKSVLDCLPEVPWTITEKDLQEREDLRHLTICSVDPPGCTDIDDALHCVQLVNGNFEVGVHIADVSHFVIPNSALDQEAANRGTTVYLVDQRIDMLPDLLSSKLCSLLAENDRFAFSVIWELDRNAKVLKCRFCKSIIRSKMALTYADAQSRLDDPNLNDAVTVTLRNLNNLSKLLKKRRLERGALTLASTEIRFDIDSETMDLIEVQAKQMFETNSMVEEFMLLANITVAEKIYTEFPQVALLRRHPPPPVSSYEPVVKAASRLGFELVVDRGGKALADSLNTAVLEANPYFNTMLRMLTTRCMTQALYFCSGSVPKELYVHFGLASPIYTHFTSPIRRYADLVVHRLLSAALDPSRIVPSMLDRRRLELLCQNLNYRHRMAQYAGRASVSLNTHLFFKNRLEQLEAYVLFVRRNALQLLIPKYGLESFIFYDQAPCNTITYDDDECCLRAGEITIRNFDPLLVQVCVDESVPHRPKLQVKLVKPFISGFSVDPLPVQQISKTVENNLEKSNDQPQRTGKRVLNHVGDEEDGKKRREDFSHALATD
ncbi:Exosome complex exonuclease RRP44 [Trichinella pseudospiralis]|uniref:Protein DIS3 homolog n=1 Tax=Trichinella pseudospiralis TaxID=6337 RepID=A0A0V1FDV7_TRIPS|nr:Exosome complex exonuclease RRP44 [Trichinella pseudospiralis]